jgi:hypothetical protein
VGQGFLPMLCEGNMIPNDDDDNDDDNDGDDGDNNDDDYGDDGSRSVVQGFLPMLYLKDMIPTEAYVQGVGLGVKGYRLRGMC